MVMRPSSWRTMFALILGAVVLPLSLPAQPLQVNERSWSRISLLRTGPATQSAGVSGATGKSLPLAESSLLAPVNNTDVRIRPTTNTTQSELSMAVSPLDSKVILASSNASDYPVSTIYGTGAYWSTDGGISWAGFDQPPSGNGNQGDPASAIGRNGYFYVGSIAPNDGQGVMRSTNGGTTWQYFQVSNPNGDLLDKNHLTVDNSPASSYQGNLYAAWTDFGQSSPYPIEGARSTDHGATWVNTQNISGTVLTSSEFGQGVNLATGPNGEVYTIFAINMGTSPYTEQAIGFNKSTNGGVAWGSGSRAISNIKGIRTSSLTPYSIRANSFPVMAVSQQTGALYVVWANIGVPGVNTGDPDVYIIKSTNGGTSWGTPVRVNNDASGNNANQFLPWVTVDPVTDQISVIFYDGRNHIGTSSVDVTVANSNDGGTTFENFIVNDSSFALGPLPGFGGNYAGDYLGIAAGGSRAYPIWMAQVPSTNAQGWVSPILYYPPNGGSVKGIVTSSGSPVSGVKIDFTNPVTQISSTTDPAGNYKSSATVEPGTTALLTLRAQKFGYVTKTETVTVVRGDTVTRNLSLATAPGGTLQVHAYRNDNSGIRAAVQVSFAGQVVVSDSTNATTGLLSVPLPTGSYDVIVDPPSPYGTRTFTGVVINVSQTTAVEALVRFVLEPSPAAVRDTLVVGQIHAKTLALTNTTAGPVGFRITDDNALLRAARIGRPKPAFVQQHQGYQLPKDVKDDHPGMVAPEGSGGPDVFGYAWIDSDEPGGPVFSWVDISGTGTPITTWSGTADDGRKTIGLPFSFPFYGASYDSVKVTTNGWISFATSSTNNSYSNTAIPASAEPNDAIYMFWDDLNLSTSGTVHYYNDVANSRFIIQYTSVPHYGTTEPGVYTFQVILLPNGTALVQYLTMQQTLNSATIGMENGTGTDGLQVVFNSAYVHDNLAVRYFVPDAPWISETPFTGTIPASGTQNITVTFDATGLVTGNLYNALLSIDPDHGDVTGTIDVPASLKVQLASSAVLILSTSTITLPATQINTTRRDTITAKNGGATTLSISSITRTNTDFTVSPASAVLTPGDSVRVPVVYTPTAVGADTGRVIFLSNSQGTPRMDVILNGTAIGAPSISVTPASVLDTLQTGTTHAKQFTITNTTVEPTTPLMVSLTEGVSWLSVAPASDTLAGGVGAPFTVTFDATGLPVGVVNTLLTISSNAPATPTTTVACTLRVVGGPVIAVRPDSVVKTLAPGGQGTDTLVIRNTGVSPLNWTLAETPAAPPQQPAGPAPAAVELPKDAKDPGSSGPVTEGQGGPDGYGYRWIDSDEPGGPAFNWVDISSIGTPITTWTGTDDDGRAIVPLPFSFPFYGITYNQLKIVTNGWVSLDVASTSNAYSNVAIPVATDPNLAIYPWWDDLDLGDGGSVHYYDDAANNRFIVQWTNVPHFTGTPGLYTFQVILNASGSVLCQYLDMQQTLNSATIGIENAAGTDGLQVIYNATYIHNAMAILFSRGISWLAENPLSGSIAPNDSAKVALTFNAVGLANGTYNGTLAITSNDFNQNPKNVPVRLTVGGGGSTVSVNLSAGWNMISNPVTTTSDSVAQLFPTASFSHAFAYTPGSGYTQQYKLLNGKGYWEKFPAAASQLISGTPRTAESIPVVAGWNLIGSISSTIDTSAATTVPPGLRVSPFFQFGAGYTAAASIIPGKAYWMKSSGAGTLNLTGAAPALASSGSTVGGNAGATDELSSLTVTDATGHAQVLSLGRLAPAIAGSYELPPPGPEGVFDVRFESDRMVEVLDPSVLVAREFPIVLRSVVPPVTVSWEIRGQALRLSLRDGVTGTVLPDRRLEGSGSLVLAQTGLRRLIVTASPEGVPSVFALDQNYPNPFNPSTRIAYALAEPATVTLAVYDLLGRRVATLVNERTDAGFFVTGWDGTSNAGLPASSGMYFCRIEARATSGTVYRNTIKMLLMK